MIYKQNKNINKETIIKKNEVHILEVKSTTKIKSHYNSTADFTRQKEESANLKIRYLE